MDIKCKYDKLVSVKSLRPHPKNRNRHPQDQIDRLVDLLSYQGIRAPIIVSNRSSLIVKGHGTLKAIIKAGETKAPVVYQDFETEEQEYAFLQSDNAIAGWADLDFSGISIDMAELGPDLNIDMLGIKNFVVDVADKGFDPSERPEKKHKTCPHCGADL